MAKLFLCACLLVAGLACATAKSTATEQLNQMDSLVAKLQARFRVAPRTRSRHRNETVAIAKLLNQVEERIIGEMQAIKAKHGKEDAAITAAFEKDLAASEAKVAAKRKMFDEATKLHSAATEQLRNMEKKLASAEGELAMAKSEKQAADGKATTDRDLDLKNNAANRDEALLLINNERNLIASIKTLLSQLNSGKKIPLATNQAAVPAATGGADMVPAAAGKRAS